MPMDCYITRTGSFLPGDRVPNDQIDRYLGLLDGEALIRQSVLAMNGIEGRFYAQDAHQHPTYSVYDLATEAAKRCCENAPSLQRISYLSAGTTYSPLSGPGICSLLHHRLKEMPWLQSPIEISSHGGICTSAASALLAAIRAIQSGEHTSALCIGTEHASEVLKSTAIKPIDDRAQHAEIRNSQWFMSVFLRSMLSDGAGAFLLSDRPNADQVSLRVNWMHSRSFAHEAPLCMKLENSSGLLTQDVHVLARYLVPTATKILIEAMDQHRESMDDYTMVLPHMSSFFFRRKMERAMLSSSRSSTPVPYWTNLKTCGNTGAASIFVMLDEYWKTCQLKNGDRILLFVPESGQFNFVLISLTVCA
jgi:3-oxoacyl-[acyl-carrier-protein] synthase III